MQNVAEKYINSGLKVLPVRKDKSPAISERWNDGISAERFDGADGIGVICGQISGGLECLDFDNHFGDAKKRLTDFMEIVDGIYEKYSFVIVQTGGGGYHVLYRCGKTEGNRKLARKPKKEGNTWKPDAVIETKGDNGYIVASPTTGYKVLRGDMTDIPVISEGERNTLIETALSFNEWVDVRREQTEEKGRPGDMYNETPEAIEDAKSALKTAGWINVRGHMWRRPGKAEGISATFGKVAPNVFYVFSANAYPFDGGSGYKPFQVVGMLTYGGDFKKLAGELTERYTPEKAPPDTLLSKARVDLSKPVLKPPIVLSLVEYHRGAAEYIRLFTLGNFSAVIGKAKSKKTIFLNLLSAAVTGGVFTDRVKVMLPDYKKSMVYFDTEQGDYDVYMTAQRIVKMAGSYKRFEMYQLREFEPMQRCAMIEEYIKANPHVGFIVVDGVADLGNAINDEEEATRITSLLMRWTKQYNCHIVNVIHQNKMNDFATGHLGSYIMKKAEIIISVTKDKADKMRSVVKCDMSRARDFDEFAIRIDDDGVPMFDEGYAPPKIDNNEGEEDLPF